MPDSFYLEGVKLALAESFGSLSKLGTSRWREAIRSGEVSPETGVKIMQGLGTSPEEWAKRYQAGIQRGIARRGYTMLTPTATPATFREHLVNKMIQTTPGGYQAMLPGTKRQAALLGIPTNKPTILASPGASPQFVPKFLQGKIQPYYSPFALGHEFHEALGMEKLLGKGVSPGAMEVNVRTLIPQAEEVYKTQKFLNWLPTSWRNRILNKRLQATALGAHVSPILPLQDIREARLMGPSMAKAVYELRAPELHAISPQLASGRGVQIPRQMLQKTFRKEVEKTLVRRHQNILNKILGSAKPVLQRLGKVL